MFLGALSYGIKSNSGVLFVTALYNWEDFGVIVITDFPSNDTFIEGLNLMGTFIMFLIFR